MQKYLPFIMYYGNALFTHKLHCLQTHECKVGHQSLGVCEVSYMYISTRVFKMKHGKDIISCGGLLLLTNM